MSADTDALVAILAEHQLRRSFVGHDVVQLASCTCGRTYEGTLSIGAGWLVQDRIHAEHAIQVLAEWVAEQKAQAWDEGYSHAFYFEPPDEDDDPVRSLNDNPYRKESSDD